MSDLPQIDEDSDLVRAARTGDFDAMDAIVRKYSARIFALAKRIVLRHEDAEEVVQQTFVSLIERLDTFREESRFRTWLTRVATNHALALLRRRAVRAALPLGDGRFDDSAEGLPHPDYIAVWKETPEQIASHRETREILFQALESLDERYRVVFLLRDVEEYSTEETAKAIGISPANVKVRLLRARLMLRERLTRVFGDESRRLVPDHRHEE